MLPELTKKQLAEASGYSYRRLHDIDMELPEKEKLFVKSEGGKYYLALFVQRWAKYSVGAQTSGEDTLDEVRATHEKIKTRKTELEVAQMEGRLVDVTEVRKLWAEIVTRVTQNLLKMPSKVAPQLVMVGSADMIGAILDDEIRQTLTSLADTPLPGAAADETEESAESGEDETGG